jgi:predicted DNA binding CopG/RHH family protein
MEKTMKTQKNSKLPQTDSIQELAKFWDAHDFTDFQDELEVVTKPVFVREASFQFQLPESKANAVRRMAKSKGIPQAELIRGWVLQKLAHRKENGRARG